jgi:hypothetical protein
MLVALPTEVITPVKFALVVTVAAVPADVMYPLGFVELYGVYVNAVVTSELDNVTAPVLVLKLVTPPELGVCQVAAVPPVAVNTCPDVGAVAELTLTIVVAEFNASDFADLPVVSWFSVGNVQFVKVPLVGVPNSGVTKVGDVSTTNLVPVPV